MAKGKSQQKGAKTAPLMTKAEKKKRSTQRISKYLKLSVYFRTKKHLRLVFFLYCRSSKDFFISGRITLHYFISELSIKDSNFFFFAE